jgi:hypothetical protein
MYFKDIDEELLKIEYIYSLKTIANLSHLRHLSISSNGIIIKSSTLILLQLSSINIELRRLQLFFDDDELCKYLNKKIKK